MDELPSSEVSRTVDPILTMSTNGTCETTSACAVLGLTGECCPTIDNWTLDCCTAPPIEKECSANAACAALNLEGECCPTIDDVFLDCCSEMPNDCVDSSDPECPVVPTDAACQRNSACAALGLDGLCCPTKDGITLDCCTESIPIAKECSADTNPVCKNLGLVDDCCPTKDDVFLDCCGEFPNDCKDPNDPDCQIAPAEASCERAPVCDALGLEGLCCPTVDGWTLDCCTATEFPKECSANPKCQDLGLEDDCCPTKDDVYLDCCEEMPNDCKNPDDEDCKVAPAEGSCELFPACKALGLTGLCCNTIDDVKLDCCTEEPINPECSLNPLCAERNLADNCCPTADGTFLDCCEEFDNQCKDKSRTECKVDPPASSCQANSVCNDLGLEGFCCPTVDGWTLDCCSGVEVEENCQENAKCAELELTGACCPTSDDKYLDCCDAVPDKCADPDACEIVSARSYAQSVQAGNDGSAAAVHNNLVVFTILLATVLFAVMKK